MAKKSDKYPALIEITQLEGDSVMQCRQELPDQEIKRVERIAIVFTDLDDKFKKLEFLID